MNVTSTQFQSYTRTRESQIAQETAESVSQDPQESFVYSDLGLSSKEKLLTGAMAIGGGIAGAIPGGGMAHTLGAVFARDQLPSSTLGLLLGTTVTNMLMLGSLIVEPSLSKPLLAASVALGAASAGLTTYDHFANS